MRPNRTRVSWQQGQGNELKDMLTIWDPIGIAWTQEPSLSLWQRWEEGDYSKDGLLLCDNSFGFPVPVNVSCAVKG